MPTAVSTLDVLSALLTPAVLISACASLLISTSNRLGRVVDDVRRLSDTAEHLVLNDQVTPGSIQQRKLSLLAVQVPTMTRRAHLLQRSLAALYASLAFFIATSVTLGLFTSFAVQNNWFATLLGLLGMALLLGSSTYLIIESRLALHTTFREMAWVRELTNEHRSE